MKILISCLSVLFFLQTHAQLRLRAPNKELKMVLEEVLNDYSKGFETLKTAMLSSTPQTASYATSLQFATAEENSITEHAGDPPVYSWSAQMLTTESYDEARKKYSSLYNDMKQMHLSLGVGNCRLMGDFGAPAPSKKFCSTDFYLDPVAVSYRIKIRLSMEYNFPEWKVVLGVYEKEREDNEVPSPEQRQVKRPLL